MTSFTVIIIDTSGHLFVSLKTPVIVLDIVMRNLIPYFCTCVYVTIRKSLYFKYKNFTRKEISSNSKISFSNAAVSYNEVYLCVLDDSVNVALLKS